jgi:putative phosphotransacetylase
VSTAARPNRADVERLVRQAVYARASRGSASPRVAPPNPLVVNVSARHCHVTQDVLERLFGKRHTLHVHRPLYQTGHFAAEEMVTIIGPRNRMISNLRILGPCRTYTQVELAYSDGIALGFDLPHRLSGNISGSIGAMLMGPAGFYEMPEGVIRAMRHVHMGPDDATHYGVKAGDMMRLKIGGPAALTLDNMLVRIEPSSRLEVHIDTDEGNACDLQPDTPVELVK